MPTRWRLWTEPATYVFYWSACVLTALGSTVYAAVAVPIESGDLAMLLWLAGLGGVQAELSRKLERMRRLINTTPHINMTSVWIFAGVLLLPPALTATLIALLYWHLAVRSWAGLDATPVYRTVINVGNTSLASYVGYLVLNAGVGDIYGAIDRGWGSGFNIGAAIILDFAAAAIIILPGLHPADKSLKELAGGLADNALEATTLGLGFIVALVLVGRTPYAVIVAVPVTVIMHWGVLYKQFEVLASRDEKTNLFNTRGWLFEAAQTLTKAEREHGQGAVLMCDLDWFKRVNDEYGHLAGDAVLRAVADVLRDNTRSYDLAARFGGEEFVVLLTDVTTEQALMVADRIRRAVTKLRVPTITASGRTDVIKNLSVSIGVEPYSDVGATILETLVHRADTALREAKLRGRNRVQLAHPA